MVDLPYEAFGLFFDLFAGQEDLCSRISSIQTRKVGRELTRLSCEVLVDLVAHFGGEVEEPLEAGLAVEALHLVLAYLILIASNRAP